MPLYLLHGAVGAADQMLPLERSLAATHDVRRIEFVGHGRTSLGDRSFTIETFAAQLLEQIDADGVERADVFGYSMGGYVALVLALQQPARVRRIVTLGTKFEWTPDVAAREAGRLDAAKIRAKVPRFAEQLEVRHADAGGWEEILASTASLLTALGDRPRLTAESLARISIPVCIGVGDRDVTVSIDESARVSRQLGTGSLMVLPDTPHPLEQVDEALLTAMLIRLLPLT
ncbi:MAG: alpha/beta hydrolase [Gemmatimonadaceae bacterium]